MPDHVQEIYYTLPAFNSQRPAESKDDQSNPQEGKFC